MFTSLKSHQVRLCERRLLSSCGRALARDKPKFTLIGHNPMTSVVIRFVKDESGATAIEYAMITSIVALGIVVSLTNLRDALTFAFDLVATGFN